MSAFEIYTFLKCMSLKAFHLDKYPFLPHFLFKTHFALKFRRIITCFFLNEHMAVGVLEALERTNMLHGERYPVEKKKERQ